MADTTKATPAQAEEVSADEIARLIKNEQRRKAYSKQYRLRPGVKEAYQARSKARQARNAAIVKWALEQDNLPANLRPQTSDTDQAE